MTVSRESESDGDRDGIAWDQPKQSGRASPRACIENARDDMNKAWSEADPYRAMTWIRSAVDWQRRALEQMAPESGSEQ